MQSTALTARQCAHTLLLVTAVEVEAATVSAAGHLKLAHCENVQPTRDIFPNRFFVGQVVARLIDKGHFDGGSDLDGAAVGLLFARNHPKQGGFTCPVGANYADDGTGRDLEAQIIDEQTVTKGLADVGELKHFVAQALGDGNENFLGFVAFLVFEI